MDVLIKSLKHQILIVENIYVASVAVLLYDYTLTFHLEVKYIWFSKWSYTKVLFFLIRYTAFIISLLILNDTVFLGVSPNLCNSTYHIEMWLSLVKIFVAETILCIRTWAIWKKNKIVGVVLVATVVVNFIAQCILGNQAVNRMKFMPPLYTIGFRGCFTTTGGALMWKQYTSLFVVEIVVVALVSISAFRLWRSGSHSELLFVVHRDGILFYVYLLVLTGANVAIGLAAPPEFKGMLMPLEDVLYSVFPARILLNIRSAAGNGGLETALHTSYLEEGPQLTPLGFVPSMSSRGFNHNTIDGGASSTFE